MSCQLSPLGPGAAATVSLQFEAPARYGSVLTNDVTIFGPGDPIDPNTADNVASVQTTVETPVISLWRRPPA